MALENRTISYKDFKTKLIEISSLKKKTTENNNNFSVNYASFAGDIDNIKGYSVKYASVCNCTYNINDNNNVLIMEEANNPGFSNVVTLTPGNYNRTDFLTELKTQIDSALTLGSVAVTLVSNSVQKLVFTFTGNTAQFFLAGSTIYKNIGLTADTGSFQAVITMGNLINLIGLEFVYIYSRVLGVSNLLSSVQGLNVVDIIPMKDAGFGEIAYLIPSDDEVHSLRYFPYQSLKSFRSIDIQLRDIDGNLISLDSNFNFNLVIKIYYD